MRSINIILMGKTGVGKSTLINEIFDKKLVWKMPRAPVATLIQKYEADLSNRKGRVTLYDTRGLELSEYHRNESIWYIKELIQQLLKLPETEFIHVVWYCIDCLRDRIEEEEIKIIQEIIKEYNLQVIIVLTKVLNIKKAAELACKIKQNPEIYRLMRENKIIEICPVLAQDCEVMPGGWVKQHGIVELEDITFKLLE